ncbi:MAG: Dabb family protein [Pedosphaera sp.]|nr:Dabb family protein [Pedosphaera sp.]MSU27813.1 Dabb family protein [Pedosphaera sp.]
MAKLNHIVLFKFKPEVTSEKINTLFNEVLEMTESIPGIENYSAGTNNSPEGLTQGYTHALLMTFTDVAARDAYLPHPEHERIRTLLLPEVASVAVFDYEV